MTQGQVQHTNVHEPALSVNDTQALITLIHNMALEIKRLSEDNAQLGAAVAMYRDALQRYVDKPAPTT